MNITVNTLQPFIFPAIAAVCVSLAAIVALFVTLRAHAEEQMFIRHCRINLLAVTHAAKDIDSGFFRFEGLDALTYRYALKVSQDIVRELKGDLRAIGYAPEKYARMQSAIEANLAIATAREKAQRERDIAQQADEAAWEASLDVGTIIQVSPSSLLEFIIATAALTPRAFTGTFIDFGSAMRYGRHESVEALPPGTWTIVDSNDVDLSGQDAAPCIDTVGEEIIDTAISQLVAETQPVRAEPETVPSSDDVDAREPSPIPSHRNISPEEIHDIADLVHSVFPPAPAADRNAPQLSTSP
ncbi:MAG: hypothetical protein RLZZ324_413 [Candidatus Parcubacteria bacterium]|jgi:hypothetical protein